MARPSKLISGPLRTERLPDGRRRLLRGLVVDVGGERIRVPAGTETDYSSIPALGRILVRWSKVDVAGVVHDWLYQAGETSRARADDIWRLVAVSGEHGANAFQGWIGWIGLRVGGWYVWGRYRHANPSEGVASPHAGASA